MLQQIGFVPEVTAEKLVLAQERNRASNRSSVALGFRSNQPKRGVLTHDVEPERDCALVVMFQGLNVRLLYIFQPTGRAGNRMVHGCRTERLPVPCLQGMGIGPPARGGTIKAAAKAASDIT